ncbi:hypothetical protein ACR6C2_43345 [Streptomyces sp. INA 01156]
MGVRSWCWSGRALQETSGSRTEIEQSAAHGVHDARRRGSTCGTRSGLPPPRP